MKQVYFDGCTEFLSGYIKQNSQAEGNVCDQILEKMPELRDHIFKADNKYLPGEFRRSFYCRQILRSTVASLDDESKKIAFANGMHRSPAMMNIIASTKDFIEDTGEESEEERAVTVIRNVLLILVNIRQYDLEMPDIRKFDPSKVVNGIMDAVNKGNRDLKIESTEISKEAVSRFYKLVKIDSSVSVGNILQMKKNPPFESDKDYYERQYRTLFLLLTIRNIELMEDIR